ncbi:hypothetical protein [Caldinitratiruptor microaerophilus]|uniref:Uncharacterized protein n=1 Tax=Caldinitratiruptor microaerophilus TaxID=671077 RepID=A0AA35CLQ0_9FIRM|nr:hypothetical protein [Caldinitratiruptor microaerophilus]BDG60713.1 hypothetical protein caldi_18030 [Caldinitratiruptor microaerophilus]
MDSGALSLFRGLSLYQWLGLAVFASMIFVPLAVYTYMALRGGAAAPAYEPEPAAENPGRRAPAEEPVAAAGAEAATPAAPAGEAAGTGASATARARQGARRRRRRGMRR